MLQVKERPLLIKGKIVLPESLEILDLLKPKEFDEFTYLLLDCLQANRKDLCDAFKMSYNVFENKRVEKTNYFREVNKYERVVSGYKVFLRKEEEGGYSVFSPDLPGCYSQGETIKEAVENIDEAIQDYLKSAIKHDIKIY